jgi:hypothetical protein
MVVVDVDDHEALARLVTEHGPLPETWTATTGSGWHYWFSHGDVRGIRGKLCKGIDLKHGKTGFVVGPPSVHPNGSRYEWLVPPYGQPTIVPVWLFEAMQPVPAPVSTVPIGTFTGSTGGHGPYSVQCLVRRIETAPEGTRHNTVRGAFLDAANQGDLDAFESALSVAAMAAEREPAEIDQIIRYAREKAG